jgi:hypothetical protein
MRYLVLTSLFLMTACKDDASRIAALEKQNAQLQSQLQTLQNQFAAAQPAAAAAKDALDSANYVSVLKKLLLVDNGDLVVSGANLFIQNGLGQTKLNGKGNLIVGYQDGGWENYVPERTGSHNLIVGDDHAYASYGCVVFGMKNTCRAPYATILGGQENEVLPSGLLATVAGGSRNKVNCDHSQLLGGTFNNLFDPYEENPTNFQTHCSDAILVGLNPPLISNMPK